LGKDNDVKNLKIMVEEIDKKPTDNELPNAWFLHAELLSDIKYTYLGKDKTHNAENNPKIISIENLGESCYFQISDIDYNKFKSSRIEDKTINVLIKAEVNSRITALKGEIKDMPELIRKACKPIKF